MYENVSYWSRSAFLPVWDTRCQSITLRVLIKPKISLRFLPDSWHVLKSKMSSFSHNSCSLKKVFRLWRHFLWSSLSTHRVGYSSPYDQISHQFHSALFGAVNRQAISLERTWLKMMLADLEKGYWSMITDFVLPKIKDWTWLFQHVQHCTLFHEPTERRVWWSIFLFFTALLIGRLLRATKLFFEGQVKSFFYWHKPNTIILEDNITFIYHW